jgi:uncharacterized protein YjiS (DUF1127 family)
MGLQPRTQRKEGNAMTISPAALIAVDAMTPGHHLKTWASRVASSARAAYARRQDRISYEQLLACDDHILKDVGVSRTAVREAMRDLARS